MTRAYEESSILIVKDHTVLFIAKQIARFRDYFLDL